MGHRTFVTQTTSATCEAVEEGVGFVVIAAGGRMRSLLLQAGPIIRAFGHVR